MYIPIMKKSRDGNRAWLVMIADNEGEYRSLPARCKVRGFMFRHALGCKIWLGAGWIMQTIRCMCNPSFV